MANCRWMRKLRCLAALCATAGVAAAANAAPKLVVPAPRIDLGELIAGDSREAAFTLTNTGDEPLQIEKVSTSCGCMTTRYPEVLGPGKKDTLRVKLVSNALWTGTVEKQITLLTNDPAQPTLNLVVSARLRPLFRFTPPNPFTIAYSKGAVLRQVFTITPAADGARITGIAPGVVGVEARLLPAEGTGPSDVTRVEVTVRPPDTGGDFTSFVMLQTSHPTVGMIPLVINAITQDGVTVSPSFLYLTGLSTGPGSGPPKLIALFKRTGAFRVLQVKSDRPELKAEVHSPAGQADDGSYREIAIRYLGGWPRGELSGTITITTDDPATPRLEVRYKAIVE